MNDKIQECRESLDQAIVETALMQQRLLAVRSKFVMIGTNEETTQFFHEVTNEIVVLESVSKELL